MGLYLGTIIPVVEFIKRAEDLCHNIHLTLKINSLKNLRVYMYFNKL